MRRPTVFLASACVVWTTAALAGPPAAPEMPLGARTAPPVAYAVFCQAHPDECAEVAAGTPEAMKTLWREAFAPEWTGAIGERATPRAPAPPVSISDAAPGEHRIALTPETLRLLDQVNREVNRAIAPAPDLAAGRPADVWSLPLTHGGGSGDCEDYVLEKRRALKAAGVPAKALSIAVARTPAGETHAVLLVATDRGELVLDNRSQWIAPWAQVGYRWVKRQAPGDPGTWVRVEL
ncbi:MAG: transglutaminase-like cysteine peptidase [Phenylobacterium sp.]|uniref:transglutaminase-like cysteine peptidase n=1 Tax=Phenylobacterium sp. TaxID=1871053 RepID=UPI00391AE184